MSCPNCGYCPHCGRVYRNPHDVTNPWHVTFKAGGGVYIREAADRLFGRTSDERSESEGRPDPTDGPDGFVDQLKPE